MQCQSSCCHQFNSNMSQISHTYIFKKVHYKTLVRPRKPQKPYVDAVVQALYEEKLSVFTSIGLFLDEDRFKSCPEVSKLAVNFYKRVNEFWKVQTNPERIIESHPIFFTKDFDFALVDLNAMVTDGPKHIDVRDPVHENHIEEFVATPLQFEVVQEPPTEPTMECAKTFVLTSMEKNPTLAMQLKSFIENFSDIERDALLQQFLVDPLQTSDNIKKELSYS